MWSKVLKVLMFVYLIVSLWVAINVGSESDQFLLGCAVFIAMFMLGSMMGVVAEIGDNTMKIKKDIAIVKRYYLAQLGVSENDMGQQNTLEQYAAMNTQYSYNQYTNGQYLNTQQSANQQQTMQNQDNDTY